MRRDMAKKLCERPRLRNMNWGKQDKYKREKIHVHDLQEYEEDEEIVLDVEDSGRSRHPMSLGRGDKELGENLAPLFRFIESKVGQPWDKVYSEIRENVRVDSATQLHIIQHLESYVSGLKDSNLIEENGKIYETQTFGLSKSELRKGEIFIHPRTKILTKYKKNAEWRQQYRRTKAKEGDVIKINDFTYYCKIEGIWHEIIYDQKWAHKNNKPVFPTKFYSKVVGHPGGFMWGENLEYKKRTLPKSILKEMGLKNAKT